MAIKDYPSAQIPAQTGNSGKYLTTNGSAPSWGTVATDKTIAQIATGTVTSGTTLSLTSLSSYDTLKFRITGVTSANNYNLNARINNSSSSVYDLVYIANTTNESDFSEFNRNTGDTATNTIVLATPTVFSNDTNNWLQIDLYNCKSTGFTFFEWTGTSRANYGTVYQSTINGTGIFKTAAAVSSLEIINSQGFTAGSYTLWGA